MRKNGTITKRVLYSLDDDHRFKCQHYKCLTCGRPSSPILGNAFVYDASAEGIKRLNEVTDALEKWESEQLNEQDLAGHIYQAVKEIYSENIIFPRGKNVIYNEPELVDIMIRNIIDCQCSEMSSNLLNLPGRGKKVPDADTLLIYLGRNSEGDVRKNLEHLFDTVNQKAKDIGLYNNPVPVAIDFHLEPYYGKQRKKTIRTPKEKSHAGTRYNFKYATADIVYDNSRLTVFGQHISQLDEKKDIFAEVVDYTRTKLDIEYLLADREFFTFDIIEYLLKKKIQFLIPAVKNDAIVKIAGENYHKGIYVFSYDFGKHKGGIEITLFTIRNENFNETEPVTKVNQEFFVFATNMPINQADGTAEFVKHSDPKRYQGYTREDLSNIYTARWGIETDYRVYAHDFRPRTASNKFPIRYMMFFSGEILRDIWVLSKIQLKSIYTNVLPKQMLRARIFKELLREGMDKYHIRQVLTGFKQQIDTAIKMLAPSQGLMNLSASQVQKR